MPGYLNGTFGVMCAGMLASAASAQITIISVSRATHVGECLNVPPDHVNWCEYDDDANHAAGPWLDTGSIGNGAATDDLNYAGGVAQVTHFSEALSNKLAVDAKTYTWAQSKGACSVQAGATTSFVVRFAVSSATDVAIMANFVTTGGSGSATLTANSGGTLFATSGIASAALTLSPGEYQFSAASACNGNCSGGCDYEQLSQWNATLLFTPAPCAADFNGDDFLDFTDFDDFVLAFEAGQASADFNGDGFLDFTDFDDFVGGFEAGC